MEQIIKKITNKCDINRNLNTAKAKDQEKIFVTHIKGMVRSIQEFLKINRNNINNHI